MSGFRGSGFGMRGIGCYRFRDEGVRVRVKVRIRVRVRGRVRVRVRGRVKVRGS